MSVQVATASLTHADILALPTTAFQVAPGAGAGTYIFPLLAYLSLTSVGNGYTNINPNASLGLEAVGFPDEGAFLTALLENSGGNGTVSALLFPGAPSTSYASLGPNITNQGTPDVQLVGNTNFGLAADNAPLLLAATNGGSDFTGGNSADTLAVYVVYAVAPVVA